MKSFRKFVESYEVIDETKYNKEWWDSKSDGFHRRYLKQHPNSIYAKVINYFDYIKDERKLKSLGYKFHPGKVYNSDSHPFITITNKNNQHVGGIQLRKTHDGYYGVTNVNVLDDHDIHLGKHLVQMAEKEYGKLKASPSPGAEEFWEKVGYHECKDGFWRKN